MPSKVTQLRRPTLSFRDTVWTYPTVGSPSVSKHDGGSPLRYYHDSRRYWEKMPAATFKQKRKSGAYLEPQPFELTRDKASQSLFTAKGSFTATDGSRVEFVGEGVLAQDVDDRINDGYASVVLPDSVLQSEALEKARKRRWNAPVALAEAHKTTVMIERRVRSLYFAVRSLRRGRINIALQHLGLPELGDSATRRWNSRYGKDARDTAANTWLELQYGWKPFLADIKSSAELLAHVVSRDTNRISRIAVVKNASVTTSTTDSVACSVESSITVDRIDHHQISKNLLWWFRIDGELTNTASLLGLTNPYEIAWELVPFSFVVDWIVPIGDYLSNLDADFGLTTLGHTIGTKYVRVRTFENPRFTQTRYKMVSFSGGSGRQDSVFVQRRCYKTAPPNPLPTSISFDKVKNSLVRLTSSLALLNQQLSSLSRRHKR